MSKYNANTEKCGMLEGLQESSGKTGVEQGVVIKKDRIAH